MIGAIIGDIAGSPYEFKGIKHKDFDLFEDRSRFTDDTAMTIAVADALMSLEGGESDEEIRLALAFSMKRWGRRYLNAGYGREFREWLESDDLEPYYSYGNGSAMRVSSTGWLYDDIDTVRHMARLSAEVTHNHPEGIKGAEAVASAIFLVRKGADRDEVKEYLEENFDYDLGLSLDDIRPGYSFDVTCMGSVPESIICYLECDSFEDAVRNAVSIGGDSDTMACMAGAIAEAEYGVPEELVDEAEAFLNEDMLDVLDRFRDLTEC